MSHQFIITEDGSHTLYLPELNENYHSRYGAKNESLHVFIQSGLHEVMKLTSTISIFEMGFGTGLNALLTYKEAQKHNLKINYSTLEAFPLRDEIVSQLNYTDKDDTDFKTFRMLHEFPWNKKHQINANFEFFKQEASILEVVLPENSFDLIYFDAFGPDVQPDLWSGKVFLNIYKACKPGAILVTYSCKGDVKRALKSVGFSIEKIPGPKGKREMIRAVKY